MHSGEPNPVDATASQSGLVLIANDHEWTARSLETILVAAGMRVVRTFTGRETLDVATREAPHLFILDQQLPDISGVEVCAALRRDPAFGASTPILITTAGPSGRQQRLAAYEAGAWEFYGQPLDGEALLHKARVFIAARREAVAGAAGTLIDMATGLYTRAGLEQRAAELASEARRSGTGLACVALAAVDGTTLHPAIVARVLRSRARVSDAAGCLGPNSFAVLAGGIGHAGATRLAERLREAMDAVPGSSGTAWRVAIAALDDASLPALEADGVLSQAAHNVAA